MVGEYGTSWNAYQVGEAPAMMAGNAYRSYVVKAANGNVYLYHNDESCHGGVHRWRIDGLSSIREQQIALTFTHTLTSRLERRIFRVSGLGQHEPHGHAGRQARCNFSYGTGVPAGVGLPPASLSAFAGQASCSRPFPRPTPSAPIPTTRRIWPPCG